MRHDESNIQRNCVEWFNLQYPQWRGLLFAVPNGGARNKIEAAIMKGEGVVAGVADLQLALPRKGVHALFIEMKTPKGHQSPSQKEWQTLVEAQGYRYEVVRSFDQFRELIEEYVK